jgi:hypothetical protein
MTMFHADLPRRELGPLSQSLAQAAASLLPTVAADLVRQVAETMLLGRCVERSTCSKAAACRSGPKVWSLGGCTTRDAAACFEESQIDDLPWIFAAAVLDRTGLVGAARTRAAGILRGLFRGALAQRLCRADGCPRGR